MCHEEDIYNKKADLIALATKYHLQLLISLREINEEVYLIEIGIDIVNLICKLDRQWQFGNTNYNEI